MGVLPIWDIAPVGWLPIAMGFEMLTRAMGGIDCVLVEQLVTWSYPGGGFPHHQSLTLQGGTTPIGALDICIAPPPLEAWGADHSYRIAIE